MTRTLKYIYNGSFRLQADVKPFPLSYYGVLHDMFDHLPGIDFDSQEGELMAVGVHSLFEASAADDLINNLIMRESLFNCTPFPCQLRPRRASWVCPKHLMGWIALGYSYGADYYGQTLGFYARSRAILHSLENIVCLGLDRKDELVITTYPDGRAVINTPLVKIDTAQGVTLAGERKLYKLYDYLELESALYILALQRRMSCAS